MTRTAYCRRVSSRQRVYPKNVTCWSASAQPRAVALVEADSRGARLILPFKVRVGEVIRTSFTDDVGLHQTRQARVAWTHRLENAGRVMVGLAFDSALAC